MRSLYEYQETLDNFYHDKIGSKEIKALIFAEFDCQKGPVITFQIPQSFFGADNYAMLSTHLIPNPDLFNRLIKVGDVTGTNGKTYKVIGQAVAIDASIYPRGRYIFNLCFVVDNDCVFDHALEPVVQKCAASLTRLEKEVNYLSKSRQDLPDKMKEILDHLNFFGECQIPMAGEYTMCLKLHPFFNRAKPPEMKYFMVPVFTRKPTPKTIQDLTEMDTLTRKVCSAINGIRCVKEIATTLNIDADFVSRCIGHLHFYGHITLLPLFLYSNAYCVTNTLCSFYRDTNIHSVCLEFVGIKTGSGCKASALPNIRDVFRLYASLNINCTMKSWCERMQPRQYNVNEQRLIQFGIFCGFVRKLSIYPISLPREDPLMCANLCDGSISIEDLAVMHWASPIELMKLLKSDGNYAFILR